MQAWKALFRIELGTHHLNPGRTKHQVIDSSGRRDFPPFKTLEICQYEGDVGFYLLYHPAAGPGTDTWHLSLEDAMHQAEWEFGVTSTEWTKVENK